MNKEILKKEQPIVYRILSNALKENRLSHAYLFVGPKGSPKEEVALLFAQSLVCSNLDEDGFACQECDVCKRMEKDESIDFYWLRKGNERIKKSDMLEVQSFFSQTSVEMENRRIYILEHFDKATPDASNSLLKFLEEPSPGIFGILLTDEKASVLPTIQSRCQWIQFRPASRKRLMASLKDEKEKESVEMLVESGYTLDRIHEILMCPEESMIHQAAKTYCSHWNHMSEIFDMQTKVFIPKAALTQKEWIRLWLEWIQYYINHQKVSVSLEQRVKIQQIVIESLDLLYRPLDLGLFLDRIYEQIYKIVSE